MTSHPQELSLFPLHTVLFPGMELPLHIFEERYKLMVRRSLETSAPFGVLLIRRGSEVGEPVDPYGVGTTAQITSVHHLEEGRMDLVAVGQQRFRLLEIVQQHPYMRGLVEALAENDADHAVNAHFLDEVRQAAVDYIRAVVALRGGWIQDVPLPSQATELSYYIAGVLWVVHPVRQRLLEVPSAYQRLQAELALLRQEQERIHQEAQERRGFHGPRRN